LKLGKYFTVSVEVKRRTVPTKRQIEKKEESEIRDREQKEEWWTEKKAILHWHFECCMNCCMKISISLAL
jgi:hypothetical protein